MNMLRAVARKLKYAAQARQGHWYLMIHQGQEPCLETASFSKIIPPRDRFWADPFVLARDGRFYIFFEEYVYHKRKAHISVLELSSNGEYSKPRTVLEREFHFSYPFLLEEDGALLMIPESRQANGIDVYVCVEFPDRWEYHSRLMDDVQAVDATLWRQENRWWLFTNMPQGENGSTLDSLHLFYRDNLLDGDWIAHPQNPIVHDITRARPAGALFMHEGMLLRPSQNCGPSYGYAVNLNRIDVLTTTEYAETLIDTINPVPAQNLHSVHTINHVPGLTVMDGLQYMGRG